MVAVDQGTTSTRCILFDQLLSTVGYELGSEPAHCALEGSIAITGSLVQWFHDGLGLIRSAPELRTLALSVDDNGGC